MIPLLSMQFQSPAIEAAIRRHCEQCYPNEACGALFGQGDGMASEWIVIESSAAPNEHGDDQRRRYLVPPAFQVEAERHASATNQEVLGYYHSHPDHPAQPSEYDRSHAWYGYLYVICAVAGGASADLNAFTLNEESSAFLHVEVQHPAAMVMQASETHSCR